MAVTRRPNILFLFTDDQRFDAVHALGTPRLVTPTMDRLVETGVTFDHACIMGSTVPAVCLPSRAMLMSGKSLYHAPPDLADTLTFPEHFRRHGYTTFATGKWHNQPESFVRSFGAGGSIFFGGMSNHLEVPVHDFDPAGNYSPEKRYIGKEFSSELFSEEAVRFLRECDRDDPFLMYVSYTAPHDPRMAPDSWEKLYPRETIELPPNFLPAHPFDNGELTIRDEQLAPWPRTPEIVGEHLGAYHAMISHLDDQMRRVLEALQESGRAEDTIIVFAGDNGLAVGQHGLLGKQSLYEHSARVPLVIAGPGLPEGERRNGLCYLMDLFPTLCDLCDLPVPGGLEGRSLSPMIADPDRRVRDDVFLAYREVQRGVRDDRYKLIEYQVNGQRTTQLFDLASDPWEMANLASDPDRQDEVRRLRERLHEWQRELDDPMANGGR